MEETVKVIVLMKKSNIFEELSVVHEEIKAIWLFPLKMCFILQSNEKVALVSLSHELQKNVGFIFKSDRNIVHKNTLPLSFLCLNILFSTRVGPSQKHSC